MINILSRIPTTMEEKNKRNAYSKEPLASINKKPFKSHNIPLTISPLTPINFQRKMQGLGDEKMTYVSPASCFLIPFTYFQCLLSVKEMRATVRQLLKQLPTTTAQAAHGASKAKQSKARAPLGEGQPSSNLREVKGKLFQAEPNLGLLSISSTDAIPCWLSAQSA